MSFEPSDLLSGYFDLLLIAEREDQECANTPSSPRIASHQMCQISAKPMKTAKNAVTNPMALF